MQVRSGLSSSVLKWLFLWEKRDAELELCPGPTLFVEPDGGASV